MLDAAFAAQIINIPFWKEKKKILFISTPLLHNRLLKHEFFEKHVLFSWKVIIHFFFIVRCSLACGTFRSTEVLLLTNWFNFNLHKLVFPVFPISRFDEWPLNAVRRLFFSGIVSNLFRFYHVNWGKSEHVSFYLTHFGTALFCRYWWLWEKSIFKKWSNEKCVIIESLKCPFFSRWNILLWIAQTK